MGAVIFAQLLATAGGINKVLATNPAVMNKIKFKYLQNVFRFINDELRAGVRSPARFPEVLTNIMLFI